MEENVFGKDRRMEGSGGRELTGRRAESKWKEL